jgi:feruloyl-CoA synthase
MQRPVRDVRLGPLDVSLDRRADGTMVVRSMHPLGKYPGRLTTHLENWAAAAPDRIFLAQRDQSGAWRHVTYAQALDSVLRGASSLIDLGLSRERPIAILSGNDVEHAILALAAMHVGIPYAPISPAYSLVSTDFSKLRTILARLKPGLVFVSDAGKFGSAITACCEKDVDLVATTGKAADRELIDFAVLAATRASPAVDTAHARVGAETIAKILYTSGTTGLPKGVINSHRMLCANQAMLRHWLSFVTEEPPVLLDWLPWNHTFGGNHNFGLVLCNGGTLYIDEGKPTPGGIAETVRNLQETAPTIYFNVPKGYEELIPRLRNDGALRDRFFSRLRLTFYAGAGLLPRVGHELDELAVQATGERILMLTSLGATETAPAALACSKEIASPGVVGVPLPGLELKLVPSDGKLEARLRGPTITPGYLHDAEQTHKAFDEEGFYCLGDAVKFVRDTDPSAGFFFDGRISEDFKLATGTWVGVAALRARFIAAFSPLVKDVVIAGHDRDDLAALVFPDIDACRSLCADPSATESGAAVVGARVVRAEFKQRLADLARSSPGSSTRIARVILLDEPPSLDANEITDKGSINQRSVLARRANLVSELYAPELSSRVISES